MDVSRKIIQRMVNDESAYSESVQPEPSPLHRAHALRESNMPDHRANKTPDDGEWEDIHAAQAGDHDAIERLFLAYEPRIYRLALTLLGHTEDARDASQETLMRWFQHLHQFDDRRPLWPWVRTICVNVCRTMIARRYRRMAFFLRLRHHRPESHPRTPESIFQNHQRFRHLLSALQKLTANERTAIVLRDLEELEVQEIADLMGCRATTVRSHLCRGRLKLRSLLSHKDGGPS